MPDRLYHYVGPPDLLHHIEPSPGGVRIASPGDLAAWIAATRQRPDASGLLLTTFIVDAGGYLWLADRHSEHVVCAKGHAVRSAGEIFFARGTTGWDVAAVSNQSTG